MALLEVLMVLLEVLMVCKRLCARLAPRSTWQLQGQNCARLAFWKDAQQLVRSALAIPSAAATRNEQLHGEQVRPALAIPSAAATRNEQLHGEQEIESNRR